MLKVQQLGIGGKVFHYIKNFLTERTFSVRINNDRSLVYEQENGIPQGSVLSPLLFAIMVNDLSEVSLDVKNSFSQYADDTAIWRSSLRLQFTCQKLQEQIDEIG